MGKTGAYPRAELVVPFPVVGDRNPVAGVIFCSRGQGQPRDRGTESSSLSSAKESITKSKGRKDNK